MDFGARPPEVNSAMMYAGPGSGSMLIAAAAWEVTAEELYSAASSCNAIISALTGEAWQSQAALAMATATAPYLAWQSATAALAQLTAVQTRAAAAAFETAFAATVPPPVIAANRALVMLLTATNVLGVNTPAIAVAEADYLEMWAQDAAAMYGYAAESATASSLTTFTPPAEIVDPAGLADQAGAVSQAANVAAATRASAMSPDLAAVVPRALQQLAQPVQSGALGNSGLSLTDGLDKLSMLAEPASSCASTMSSSMSATSSLSSVVKTLSSVETAAAPLEGEAAAAGPALPGELGVGALPAGLFAGLGAPESAVSAEVGRAVALGPLSVPQSWTASAAASGPIAAPLSGSGLAAGSGAQTSGTGNMLGGLPFAGMAPRGEGGLSGATVRPGGIRPTVMPRPEFLG